MKKINNRKLSIIFFMAVAVGSLTIAFQNFTKFESHKVFEKKETNVGDALSAALETAAKDHEEKQIALNVEPSQVEASLKKKRSISTVEINPDISVEDKNSARETSPEDDSYTP